jgi:serine protease AprX
VGAVDSTGHIALFSSRGPTFDGRLNPSVVAMGLWTGIQSSLGGFTRASGTSFSAPLMTGASASLWQAYPETPARELIYRIRESGKRNANPDATYGYGIPSFKTAGWLISGTGPVPPLAETLHLFPNPSTGRFTVSLPGNPAGVFRILITDMNGRQIMTGSTSLPGEIVLPPGMPAGIYILEAESGQGIYRSLFMKE